MNQTKQILLALAEAEEHAAEQIKGSITDVVIETEREEAYVASVNLQIVITLSRAEKLREIAAKIEDEQDQGITNTVNERPVREENWNPDWKGDPQDPNRWYGW